MKIKSAKQVECPTCNQAPRQHCVDRNRCWTNWHIARRRIVWQAQKEQHARPAPKPAETSK